MVRLQVNGHTCADEVEARLLLVDYLRDRVGLTGTKIGCDTSNCGACTVHLDGRTVKSCTLLAVQADGSEVTTIEGLAGSGNGGSADPRSWHPVQRAFHEQHGLQCGYCTPGMIMSTVDLLREHPEPTEDDIRHGLEGNLCRCTGYRNIVKAVRAASREMRASSAELEPQPEPPEPDRVDSPRLRSVWARAAPLAGGVLLALGLGLLWRALRAGRRSAEKVSNV